METEILKKEGKQFITIDTNLIIEELIENEKLKSFLLDNGFEQFVGKIDSIQSINEYYKNKIDRIENKYSLETLILFGLVLILLMYILFH